jgi:shikimate kinase
MAPAPQDAAPPLNRLPVVRQEFMAAMADVTSDDAERLRWRLQEARSLRELWHVRADLYRVVAVARNQSEAEQRLLLLNRHFPARAPRSQLGAL